jgi:hypothetical protein
MVVVGRLEAGCLVEEVVLSDAFVDHLSTALRGGN